MLLEPLDKVEGILYPQDLEDTSAWQYDALLNSKITLVAFSPEIQNPKIIFLESIVELPNHQLSVQGYGSFQVSDKTYSRFRVVVDKENLPAVVKEENLYSDEENLKMAGRVNSCGVFAG